MPVIPKLTYRFNANSIEILANYFVDIEKTDSKVYLERQNIWNRLHNIEEKCRGQILFNFKAYYK
jgi:hypothetical protein